MSRMKEYLSEIEDLCTAAIEAGASNEDEVIAYVNTESARKVPLTDVVFVLEKLGYTASAKIEDALF